MKIEQLPLTPNTHAPHTNIIKTDSITQELNSLIQQYRAAENSPGEQRAILVKIKDFLEKNKELIEEDCAHNGWSQSAPNWQEHYETFFNDTINLINQAEDDPQTGHGLFFDTINEGLTQLSWLMGNIK